MDINGMFRLGEGTFHCGEKYSSQFEIHPWRIAGEDKWDNHANIPCVNGIIKKQENMRIIFIELDSKQSFPAIFFTSHEFIVDFHQGKVVLNFEGVSGVSGAMDHFELEIHRRIHHETV